MSNPYAARPIDDFEMIDEGDLKGLTIVATILMAMAMLTLAMSVGSVAFNLAMGIGFAPPPELDGPGLIGFRVGQIGGIVVQLGCQIVTVVGAIAMIRRKYIGHAWAGAVCSLVPICGPCIGFSIPLAIWAILLLRKPSVKAAFAANVTAGY